MERPKTNVVRLLEHHGIDFLTAEYEVQESTLGAVNAARKLGVPPETLFKTLVCRSSDGAVFVCCIPGNAELDLKKAARAVGAKKADLVRVAEIEPLTGYIKGGCSPIDMKRDYPVLLEEAAFAFDRIYVNGGARGLQVYLEPKSIVEITGATPADLIR